jgi:hypothetical protein
MDRGHHLGPVGRPQAIAGALHEVWLLRTWCCQPSTLHRRCTAVGGRACYQTLGVHKLLELQELPTVHCVLLRRKCGAKWEPAGCNEVRV